MIGMDADVRFVKTDERRLGYDVFEVLTGDVLVGKLHRTGPSRWKGISPEGRTVVASSRNHVGVVMAQWAVS